jgi:lantibiotic biosynthesis protein
MVLPADTQIAGPRAPLFSRWPAVLDGSLHTGAITALRDILDAIPRPGAAGSTAPSMATGAAGHALFFAYAVRSGLFEQERADLRDRMTTHLQVAVDRLQDVAGYPFLFEGLAGVGWVANHLHDLGLLDEGEELCDAVDAALIDWLKHHYSSMLCELVAGLAGLGAYGLARWPRSSGREIVRLAVEALAATSVEHQGYRTWFSSPENISELRRSVLPQGSYNLGLSHGVPGALAFLAKAGALGVAQAGTLANSAGTWLLGQQRRYPNGSRFATQFLTDPGAESQGSRLSWCYGDLGVSAALMVSARPLRRADWEAAALQLARAAVSRENAHVMDGGLCHGAFGNAHIFQRFFRATGEACFLEAARRWLRTGFDLRKDGQGLAGFLALAPGLPESPEELTWLPESGFLEGISGIGLVLLGFLSPMEPGWDQLLMVDIPPMLE